MFLIPCPYCGPRDESEFSCGGEAHIARPLDTDRLNDAEWADYLFNRTNTKGVHRERWVHTHGCRRWFNVVRHTATDQILAVYRMGEDPPPIDDLTPLPTPCGEPRVGAGDHPLVPMGEGVTTTATPAGAPGGEGPQP